MGCSAGVPQTKDQDISKKKKKVLDSSDNSIKPGIKHIDLVKEKIAKLISDFNINYTNNEGVQIKKFSSRKILFCKSNSSVSVLSEIYFYFSCLPRFNLFLNDLNNDVNFNLLKAQLKGIEPPSEKICFDSANRLNLHQKIYSEYECKFKLKSIKTGQFEDFDLFVTQEDTQNKAVVFLFYDILSYEAIAKINQIRLLNNSSGTDSDNNCGFIFLPIMNLFVGESDDLKSQREFLTMSKMTDCYVLVNPINLSFIRIFHLDGIINSKLIVINRQGYVNLILDDKIEFMNIEMLKLFLTDVKYNCNNETTLDHQNEIVSKLRCDNNNNNNNNNNDNDTTCLNSLLQEMKAEYSLSVNFDQIIDDHIKIFQFPVMIYFKYSIKDLLPAQNVMKCITDLFAIYSRHMTYSLCSKAEENLRNEILVAFDYIRNILYEQKIPTVASNYELISEKTLTNGTQKALHSVVNLKLSKDIQWACQDIIKIFSTHLYNNPQFAKLKVRYSITPECGVKLNLNKKERLYKLFIDNAKQLEFDIAFKEEDRVNTIAQIQESIIQQSNNKKTLVLVLNPNYLSLNSNATALVDNYFNSISKFAKSINLFLIVFAYSYRHCIHLRNLHAICLYDDSNSPLKLRKFFMSSSEVENYSKLCFYSEDAYFKQILLDENCSIINFIDLDSLFLSLAKGISIPEIEKLNKSISQATEVDDIIKHLQNVKMIKNKLEFQGIKNFYVKQFREVISHVSENSVDCLMTYTYTKILKFQSDSFSSFQQEYENFYVDIIYPDTFKKNFLFDEMRNFKMSQDFPCGIVKLNIVEEKILTVSLPKMKNCQQCKAQVSDDTLYICFHCKKDERVLFCGQCADIKISEEKEEFNEDDDNDEDFYAGFVMDKSSPNTFTLSKKNAEIRKCGHSHPLVVIMCDLRKNSGQVFLYERIYLKYTSSNDNSYRKQVRTCYICENYITFDMSKPIYIVISQLNPEDLVNREFVICDECFHERQFGKLSASRTSLALLQIKCI